jgi:hypothetical protein
VLRQTVSIERRGIEEADAASLASSAPQRPLPRYSLVEITQRSTAQPRTLTCKSVRLMRRCSNLFIAATANLCPLSPWRRLLVFAAFETTRDQVQEHVARAREAVREQ